MPKVPHQKLAVVIGEMVARGEQRVEVLPEGERGHNLLGPPNGVVEAAGVRGPTNITHVHICGSCVSQDLYLIVRLGLPPLHFPFRVYRDMPPVCSCQLQG